MYDSYKIKIFKMTCFYFIYHIELLIDIVQWKYGAFWSKRDFGYIRHVFCVSGRICDTFHKSVGCHVGTLGEFFLFTKIQDGRQSLYSKKLTIPF